MDLVWKGGEFLSSETQDDDITRPPSFSSEQFSMTSPSPPPSQGGVSLPRNVMESVNGSRGVVQTSGARTSAQEPRQGPADAWQDKSEPVQLFPSEQRSALKNASCGDDFQRYPEDRAVVITHGEHPHLREWGCCASSANRQSLTKLATQPPHSWGSGVGVVGIGTSNSLFEAPTGVWPSARGTSRLSVACSPQHRSFRKEGLMVPGYAISH